jgi:hypothetical protein
MTPLLPFNGEKGQITKYTIIFQQIYFYDGVQGTTFIY